MRLFKSKNRNERDGKVQVVLCYHANSFIAKDVAELIKKDSFGFTPATVETDDEPVEFRDHFVTELEKMTPEESDTLMGVGTGVTLMDESEELQFKIIHPGRKNRPQVIYWVIKDLELLDSEFFHALVTHNSFTAGYCADLMDMRLQSEKNLGIYKSHGVKPEHVTTNEYGDKVVDISKNPGRKKLVQFFWLASCWRMWFGSKFQEFVDAEHIQKFNEAEIKNEGNIIAVRLYDDPYTASDKKNRRVQQDFRSHLDLDRLEKVLR